MQQSPFSQQMFSQESLFSEESLFSQETPGPPSDPVDSTRPAAPEKKVAQVAERVVAERVTEEAKNAEQENAEQVAEPAPVENASRIAEEASLSAESSVQHLLKHPDLWRADQLTQTQRRKGIATGFETLDEQLADQGWPSGGLMELMLPTAGVGELRLLLPAMRTLSQTQSRWIAWVNPPFLPYAPALQALGVDINKILLIHPRRGARPDKARPDKARPYKARPDKNGRASAETSAQTNNQKSAQTSAQTSAQNSAKETLWTLEKACKSGVCSMVLAWPDETYLKTKDTQRLQVAARQGETLCCLMRPFTTATSMAELRLAIHPERPARSQGSDTLENMRLEILKRRGGWPITDLKLPLAEVTATQRTQPEDVEAQISLWRKWRERRKHLQQSSQAQKSNPELNQHEHLDDTLPPAGHLHGEVTSGVQPGTLH